MKKFFTALLVFLTLGVIEQAYEQVYAQTPAPARMGIQSTANPNILQTLDSGNGWSTLGTINPSTHVFTPVSGGGGGSPVTYYATHAALLAGTTGLSTQIIYQNDFYANGGGIGAAAYTWNSISTCPLGMSTSGDNVTCILPIGQSAGTPGRYILSAGTTINAAQLGFAPTTATSSFDNYPIIPNMNSALGPPTDSVGGLTIQFPPIPGQTHTTYYFSNTFIIQRGVTIKCGDGVSTYNGVSFVFAAGVRGIVMEDAQYTSDGGAGTGSVEGCGIYTAGQGGAGATPGSASVGGIVLITGDPNSQTPPALPAAGDGVIIVPRFDDNPATLYPIVPTGTIINSTADSDTTLNLNNVVSTQFSAAQANFIETGTNNFTAGDTITVGNSTYTFVNSIGSTPGNVFLQSTFINSAVNLAHCINLNTTTSTCVAQSSPPNITADIPYDNIKFWSLTGGTGGNSLTSTSVTSAGHFLASQFAGGFASNSVVVIDLPGPNAVSPSSNQMFTADTVSGSNAVFLTNIPRFISPGEWIWNQDFIFGSLVLTVRGGVRFIETGSNNFNVGDVIQNFNPVGNNTYTFVNSLVNPGDVLKGSTFAASAANLAGAIGVAPTATRPGTPSSFVGTIAGNTLTISGVTGTVWYGQTIVGAGVTSATILSGSGTTWTIDGSPQTVGPVSMTSTLNYIIPAATVNAGASVSGGTISEVGYATGPFNGTTVTAVYIPNGTAAGAFDHATFMDQQITVDGPFQNATGRNATGTHTAAPLWGIPVGLKRDVTSQSKHNSIQRWPIGLEMPCSTIFLGGFNCTFSSDYDNFYLLNLFARVVSGNNTAGSGSVNESAADSYGADLLELATLSSSYFNFNAHSPESGGSNAGILKNCINLNASFNNGGYLGVSEYYGQYPGCANGTGNLFASTPGGMLQIVPVDSWPFGANIIGDGSLVGTWTVNNPNNFTGIKTAGSCTFTISRGVITNITGC